MTEWILPTALTGVAVTITFIMVYLERLRSLKSEYNEDKRRVELDELRRQIEIERMALERRLAATSAKWQEMYQHVVTGQRATDELQIRPVPQSAFLSSFGIDPASIPVKPNFVFVLMPFHPEYQPVFDAVRDICSKVGWEVVRGDERNVHGDILPHILREICRARLVLAIIQDRNPNVFYELGIAHALDKSAILLARSLEEVPFDLRGKMVLFYDAPESLRVPLTESLARINSNR